jgi:hypothetical protein
VDDEILVTEAREQLAAQGITGDDADAAVEAMRDEGMFRYPEW